VTPLPAGARIVALGHSKVSVVSSPGRRSFMLQAIDRSAGRVRYSIAGDQGIGGQTQAQIAARAAYTIAQKPDIIVLQTAHNSLGDGASAVIAANDALDTAIAAGCPSAIRLWLTETPSSTYPLGNATLDAVNADIMAKASGLRQALDVATGFVHATMTYDGVHENGLGAEYVGGLLAAKLDTLVAAQTVYQALTDIGAAREHGANLDPKYALGTGSGTGAKAGTVTPTGTVPDGYTLTNNTTAAVAASMVTWQGLPAVQIDITGGVAVEGTVILSTNNVSGARVPVSAAIGDIIETLCGYNLSATDGVSAPAGALIWAYSLPTSSAAFSFSNWTSTDANLGGATTAATGPRVARTYEKMQMAAMTNMSPSFGIRVATGAANIRLIFAAPILRKTDLVAYAPPAYVGADGIVAASLRLGPSSGVLSMATGVGYAIGPGLETGGGTLTFSSVRVYAGGSSAIGSGTLETSLAVGATYTPGSSGTRYFEVDVTNSLGSVVTHRSAAFATT